MSVKEQEYKKVIERFLDGKANREELYAADPYRGPREVMAHRIAENHFKRSKAAANKKR